MSSSRGDVCKLRIKFTNLLTSLMSMTARSLLSCVMLMWQATASPNSYYSQTVMSASAFWQIEAWCWLYYLLPSLSVAGA